MRGRGLPTSKIPKHEKRNRKFRKLQSSTAPEALDNGEGLSNLQGCL